VRLQRRTPHVYPYSIFVYFFKRIEVLKRLHLIDDKNFVLLKGKVALEISMSELIITELIIENVFSQMQPCEIVSLLSGIVYQQKSNQQSDENFLKTSFNNAALDQGRDRMVQIATQLNNVQKECQLQVFICDHLVYM
jgi:antiviral helicase SKI2